MTEVTHDKSAKVRWNLEEVLPARSGKLFQSLVVDDLEGMVVEFESARSELGDSITNEKFQALLDLYEKIARTRSRLGSYAYMFFTEDTRSQEGRTFKARVEEIDADAANRTLFFDLWWKSLNDKKSQSLLSSSGNFAYFLLRLIQTKPYTLTEAVEQVINLKDITGRSALLQLYHQVRDSFVYEIETSQGIRKLTDERVRDLFHSRNREERNSAYSMMMSRFEQNKDVLGEIYLSLVRDWRNEGIKLRKYANPISIRNVGNDIPDEAVKVLQTTCKKNTELFKRYFRLKSKLLNISDFSRTDVYAPLPIQSEKSYSWEEGVKLISDTLGEFSQTFAGMATNVIAQSHVDAEPREGKLGGAYCISVTPEITPYVLLSYTGTPRSVATLAHELGHAIHSQLASKSNNQLTYEAPLPLAETASVFGEMLLTDKLLAEADEATRQALLAEHVDDSYATIMRQAFFSIFEVDAHEAIASGANIDELSGKYLTNLNEQFGDALTIPEYFKYEWLSIPHIYQSPFYCYAYAWGNLLVLALYRLFKQEGKSSFVPRYIKILSYGGGESPERILGESGFDIESEAFWQAGFDELANSVSELEKLI